MKYFLFFLFITSSFLFGEEERLYLTYVSNLQNIYAKELQKSGLRVLCKGGALMNDVEQIGLDFFLRKYVDVNEARRLYVKYSEPFLRLVNANRKLRPYLHNYPATINEIGFSISFAIDPTKDESSQVRHVFYGRGEVSYFAPHTNEIHHETYEEALKIVHEEQQKQPNDPLSIPSEFEKQQNKN